MIYIKKNSEIRGDKFLKTKGLILWQGDAILWFLLEEDSFI
jgi:hypothetical protein